MVWKPFMAQYSVYNSVMRTLEAFRGPTLHFHTFWTFTWLHLCAILSIQNYSVTATWHASSLVNVQSKRNCTNFYETQKLKSGWRQSKLPVKLISRQVLLLSEFWFESLVRGNTYRQETDSSRTLDLFRVNACLFALVKSWFLSFLSLFSLAFSIRGALSVTRGTVFHSYSICSTVAWQWHKVTMMAPVHSIKMGPNACLLQSSLFGVAGTHTVQQGHSSSLDNTNPNCKSTQTRWFEW